MKNNEVVKYGFILFAITAVCTAIVAFMYGITDPIIQKQAIEKEDNARKTILTSAKTFEKIDQQFGDDILEVYKGMDGDKVVGYTIKTSPKGYNGNFGVITAITADKKISGVSLTNLNETPGLGAKAKDAAFIDQYKDKPAKELKVIKNGSPKDDEIVAIAGATITSSAVTKGVNASIKTFDSQLNQ